MLDRIITSIFEGVTVLGCIVGAYFLFLALGADVSAPQGAELAALGIGFAAVPYCLAGVCHRGTMRRMAASRRIDPD